MQFSHKDIYQSIVSEIDKRIQFATGTSYNDQLARTETFSALAGEGRTSSGLIEIIQSVQDLLESTLPGTIIEGLNVIATNPISSNVTVGRGSGSIGGKEYAIRDDTTIKIPLTDNSSIYYILLYGDRLIVSKTVLSKHLQIAKIVVPTPGTTTHIQDTKGTGVDKWNAYIVNLREYKLYGDENGNLEEDSIEFLKDAIGDILADNIIGNIKLSENLKIINTQGTLEIDSKSIQIFDTSENVLAKFNKDGTFYYNTDGQELAKFTRTEARVGNILITPNSIQSGNFISGALGSGFKIQDSGLAEFQDIIIRGKITSSVLEYASTSALGGNFLISHDADVLNQDMTSSSTSLITDGDVQFASGDILWLKDGTNSEYMTISAVISITNYTVTRASGGSAVAWKKGTGVVNLGQSGDGGIYLTASESNAPYISVFTHAGSPWSSLITKLRIGNLNGFLGYSSDEYGIAIGTVNDYLKYDSTNGLQIKGNITVTGGNASIVFYQITEPISGMKQGDYWIDTDDDNKLYIYQSSVWVLVATGATATGITTFRQSGIPTAVLAGDLWIDTDDDKLYRATNVGDDQITAGEWELQNAAIATGWSHGSDITKIDGGTIYTETIIANAIAAATITADKYNEMRNTYIYSNSDSLDGSYDFIIPFKIVSEMNSIESIKVSFEIKEFRAYSTTVPSGGSSTSGATGSASGGGSTSGATGSASGGSDTSGQTGGAHYHTIPIVTAAGAVLYIDDDGVGCTSNGTITTSTSEDHTHTFPLGTGTGGAEIQTNVGDPSFLSSASGGGVVWQSSIVDSHYHQITINGGIGGSYQCRKGTTSIGCDKAGGVPNGVLYTTVGSSSHTHTTPDHTHPNHQHSTPAHTHPNHEHSTPAHTHSLTYGIFEDSQSPTIHYHINNGGGYGGASANYNSNQTDLDISGGISGTGWKHIKFSTSVRCRLNVIIECKLDISA